MYNPDLVPERERTFQQEREQSPQIVLLTVKGQQPFTSEYETLFGRKTTSEQQSTKKKLVEVMPGNALDRKRGRMYNPARCSHEGMSDKFRVTGTGEIRQDSNCETRKKQNDQNP